MRTLATIGLIGIAVMMLAVFRHWETKEIKLKYIGTISIDPPADTYRQQTFWIVCGGERCREALDKHLFFEIELGKSNLTINGSYYPKFPDYTIKWSEELQFKEDKFYYICVGCEIETMTYYYNRKTTRNNKTWFQIDTVIRKPLDNRSGITIYESDVDVGL